MELKSVPRPVGVFLDANEVSKISKTIDDFFQNTKEYVESVHDKSKPHKFEIRSGEIRYSGLEQSHGMLTYMFYDDKHVVAGVVETRTEFNNLRYTFFRDLSCLERSISP